MRAGHAAFGCFVLLAALAPDHQCYADSREDLAKKAFLANLSQIQSLTATYQLENTYTPSKNIENLDGTKVNGTIVHLVYGSDVLDDNFSFLNGSIKHDFLRTGGDVELLYSIKLVASEDRCEQLFEVQKGSRLTGEISGKIPHMSPLNLGIDYMVGLRTYQADHWLSLDYAQKHITFRFLPGTQVEATLEETAPYLKHVWTLDAHQGFAIVEYQWYQTKNVSRFRSRMLRFGIFKA